MSSPSSESMEAASRLFSLPPHHPPPRSLLADMSPYAIAAATLATPVGMFLLAWWTAVTADAAQREDRP